VVKLTRPFIPAADEVGDLESGRDAASRLYQKIATRHIRGLRTSQGTYILTPTGILLASRHSINEDELAEYLAQGLEKYKQLSAKERLGTVTRRRRKSASLYPDDGLVLSLVLRKFYSRKPVGRAAIGVVESNRDFAWFKKKEAEQFLPLTPKESDTYDVPRYLVERLARYHFTDTVRAFADPYPARCVKEAQLTATVLAVRRGVVKLRYDGTVRSEQDDTPRFGLTRERGRLPRRPERSFQAKLLGYATFDQEEKRFTEFELVALGTQQGGGERGSKDLVAIGVALTLAKDSPVERIEPFHLELYRWN
jgi:hypothetical protein